MSRILALSLFLVLMHTPQPLHAQRFGGQFGAGGGFWLPFIAVDVDEDRGFGRDLGQVVGLGGRGFLQTGRVRLGGGGLSGTFTDEGLNSAGNEVTGSLSVGGFTFEYLVVQGNLEVTLGGMVGGGIINIEESIARSGGVEMLNRRRDAIFTAFPWARLGYNPATFVNVGLQVGYLVGTKDYSGFVVGVDVVAGIIP